MVLRKTFTTLLLSLFVVALSANNREFRITLTPDSATENLKIYIRPLEKSSDAISELPFDGVQFVGNAVESQSGFYQLTGVQDNMQMFIYLYLPGSDVANVQLAKGDKCLSTNQNADNKALSSYAQSELNTYRAIWNEEETDSVKLANYVNSSLAHADSIISGAGCCKEVEEFIKIWSYSVAQNVENILNMQLKREGKPLPSKSLLPSPKEIFDNDKAMFFPSTVSTVLSTLPRDASLTDKYEALFENYTSPVVRKAVGSALVSLFISKHNYNEDFEGGLAQLKVVTEKYGADESVLKDYEKRRATIKGTPFPENIVLRDVNGNTVDFSTFKGKYVYIDLWASWCGPCKREIPVLQKLEKELQNENVVFVSISVDSKEEAWKKAMTTYDMHGYQLIDTNNAIGQALNVRGIPFFAIYDKEGRLYMHNAPRPSIGKALKEMLEGLK